MSIGNQFLNRLMTEAKKAPVEKKEPAPATFVADAGTERMKAMMRGVPDNMHQDLADEIAELANAAGVPGSFLNKTEIRKAFIQSAIKLKNMPTRLKYFRLLHKELTAARIGNLPSSGGGGISMKKGAEDEKSIVGTAIQELMAEILVDFGVPVEYFTKEAPTPLKTSLKRAGITIVSNSAVKNAIKSLARGEGIRSGDDTVGSKKPGMKVAPVKEARDDERPGFVPGSSTQAGRRSQMMAQSAAPQKIEAGAAAFIEAAHSICAAFGIPQKTMDLPVVAAGIRRAAMKDASNSMAKSLMVKLLAQLQKRD